MRVFFVCLFIIETFIQLHAQVVGKVIGEQNQPLPYANIVLLALPDSVFIAGTVSDENGNFSLNVHRENVLLRVSSIGYLTIYSKVENADVGMIQLSPDAQLLGEVIVTGSMPVTRMQGDALVTNIQNSILSKTGSASDVLTKLPGVSRERDEYEVLGKGKPLIYINNRQVRDDAELEQLSSNNIKSVEVVNTPGARYDATVAAVIRIKTLKQEGEGLGFAIRSSYYQSQNTDLIEQLNVNYRNKGLDIFGMFGYMRNEYIMMNDITHLLDTDSLWKHQNLQNGTIMNSIVKGEIGVNYSLSKKHSLGFRYALSARPYILSDILTNSYITADGVFYDNIENKEYSETSGKPAHILNVYYNGTIGKLNIDFNGDYYTNTSDKQNLYVETSQEQIDRDVRTRSYVNNRLLASKLIMCYPLWKGNVSAGVEYTNTCRRDEYYNISSTLAKVKESGIASFVEYRHPLVIGNFVIGMRYEHVVFDYYENGIYMGDKSRKYDNWFPNISFSSKIKQVRMLLSYTAKTKRPTYSQLSNNLTYVDRFTCQQGNPLLEPCIIHDVSLTGIWRFMQLLVSYQQCRKDIVYTGSSIDNRNSMLLTYRNYNRQILDMTLSLSPIIGMWHPSLSFNVRKQWLEMDGMKFDKPRPKFRLNNTFDLPQGFLVSLDGYVSGKGNHQNLYQYKWYGIVNFSICKSFWKDALSVELRGNDIFHGSHDYWQTYFGSNIRWKQTNHWDTREFSITLRYKFNAAKSKYKGTGAGQEQRNRM